MQVERFGGYIRDDARTVARDLATRHIEHLLGGRIASGISGKRDWAYMEDRVFDQGQTSSCVGNCISQATFLGAKASGAPIAQPSRKWIYDHARSLLDGPGNVEDTGCQPSVALTAMTQFGVCSEEDWPLFAAPINSLPPFDLYQKSVVNRRHLDWYRIDSGPDAVITMQAAIDARHCPIIGMQVDQKFERLGSGEGIYGVDDIGVALGWHALCVVGYDASINAFKVLNSWGRSWGDDGHCWISAKRIASTSTADKIVVSQNIREVA
jgi:Papain family cysteine protease